MGNRADGSRSRSRSSLPVVVLQNFLIISLIRTQEYFFASGLRSSCFTAASVILDSTRSKSGAITSASQFWNHSSIGKSRLTRLLPTELSMSLSSDKSVTTGASASSFPPRAQATAFMAAATALHFGGYEFIRNSCLALFTSSDFGFKSPAAFPLANGLISPFSLLLLHFYSRQLDKSGPRAALRITTLFSILFILTATASLWASHYLRQPQHVRQLLIGITFLFQSSYQYLLYTQQWSFVSSVLTPAEGAKWIAVLAGFSSLTCTFTGSAVPYLLPHTGLLGLMALTALTLTGTLLCSDHAYGIAQKHGFDPAKQNQMSHNNAATVSSPDGGEKNRLVQTIRLFRRVPTLAALFTEVLSFQSLNTILNVAFVNALTATYPKDLDRSAYTSRLFSIVNGVSAALQFLVLPFTMKHLEPAIVWRAMPVLPLSVCLLQTWQGTSSLTLLAFAFAAVKTMDYSIRTVVYILVYQPLDFESRYVGKEIIGVLGSRFGKSGMSLLLSAISLLGLTRHLSNFPLLVSLVWCGSTWSLASVIPRKEQAQAIVAERQLGQKAKTDQSKED